MFLRCMTYAMTRFHNMYKSIIYLGIRQVGQYFKLETYIRLTTLKITLVAEKITALIPTRISIIKVLLIVQMRLLGFFSL